MAMLDIFTDGSYMSNKNGIKCGYGVYFPNGEYKNIGRKFKLEPLTNNRAELYAIYKALKAAYRINEKKTVDVVNIYSDSKYCIQTITVWYYSWIREGKEYKNKDIIDKIMKLKHRMNMTIIFTHVKSHTKKKDYNSINNDHADELAKAGGAS